MTSLTQLQPHGLWGFFAQFCAIPHPSKHEAALSQWIQTWAHEQGLPVVVDEVGNLIIKKPASPGMEDRKGVILQAHIDMVPQANADTAHDFTRDPIQAYVDGEWVRARGTTLGADNGIGAAACLAVLGDHHIKHGPLEVLLTIDEEAGMTGAKGLQPGLLDGEILLNTDSEQDGEVCMGCAGGVDAQLRFAYEAEPVPADHQAWTLKLSGLRGGHSGVNIHEGRGNANKLLARLLDKLSRELPLRLAELSGGTLRNAIPREAHALLLLPGQQADVLAAALSRLSAPLKTELAAIDGKLDFSLTPADLPNRCLSLAAQRRLLDALLACPNGVIRMSDVIGGVVETSTNMGVISTEDEAIKLQCLIRSLNESGREQVEQMTQAVADLAGADCQFSGRYPGWTPDPASPIMGLLRETHKELFDSEPKIMVIHAGLECGLFHPAYPHWDMVSFGPTIQGAHSPDERVHIPAVHRFWQLLISLLEQIPSR